MTDCKYRWRVNVFPKDNHDHVESFTFIMICDFETCRSDTLFICHRLGLRAARYVIINDRSFVIKGHYDFVENDLGCFGDHFVDSNLAEQDV